VFLIALSSCEEARGLSLHNCCGGIVGSTNKPTQRVRDAFAPKLQLGDVQWIDQRGP
jgi:biotin synthase-like enzyme